MWSRLEVPSGTPPETAADQRLRVAAVLAQLDPGSPRWEPAAAALVDALLGQNPIRAGEWAAALRPVVPRVHPALAAAVQLDGIGFANVTTWEGGRKASVFDLEVAARRVTVVSVPPPE